MLRATYKSATFNASSKKRSNPKILRSFVNILPSLRLYDNDEFWREPLFVRELRENSELKDHKQSNRIITFCVKVILVGGYIPQPLYGTVY